MKFFWFLFSILIGVCTAFGVYVALIEFSKTSPEMVAFQFSTPSSTPVPASPTPTPTVTPIPHPTPQPPEPSPTEVPLEALQESFSLPYGLYEERSFSARAFQNEENKVYPFRVSKPLYGLALSGTVKYDKPTSLVRVILVDQRYRHYVLYEGYPLITGEEEFSVEMWCDETCMLDEVIPLHLVLDVWDGSITVDTLYPVFETSPTTLAMTRETIKEDQDQYKVRMINESMKQRKPKWTAGETEISRLWYDDKKKLFTYKVPNIQGMEYYRSGIFTIATQPDVEEPDESKLDVLEKDEPSLPVNFDWRDRHGENWITQAGYQAGCGSCWAFSSIGVAESLINMYYNQMLNVDLSEQDVICKHPGSCSAGNFLYYGFREMREQGILTEDCRPHTATEECGQNFCEDTTDKLWRLRGYDNVKEDDEAVKRAIIQRGPVTFGVRSLWHFMMAVGFDTAPNGNPVWIIKNSWGTDWGENGFIWLVVPESDRYGLMYADKPFLGADVNRYDIACEDRDGDTYCQWGISSSKPESCPESCAEVPDCDDTNPELGGYDENLRCEII